MSTQAAAGIVVYQPDVEILGRLLSRLEPGGRRIFIFVNGPIHAETSALLARLANARLILSDENIGLGAGLNALAAAAISESCSHIILFDQDSEPAPDLPEQLLARWIAATKAGTRLAVVGPLLVPPEHGHYRQIRYDWRDQPRQGPLTPVHFVPTSGSLICLAAFAGIGPFRDDFFIGGIDVEWGFRAWSKGYGAVVAKDITMVHRWGEAASPAAARTPQILRHSGLRLYYYFRNAIYCLGLPFIPLTWRLRSCLGLGVQIGLLIFRGRGLRKTWAILSRALRDSRAGRLGPVPSDFPKDILQ